MKDRFSTTSQLELTRRDMLKGVAAAGGQRPSPRSSAASPRPWRPNPCAATA